MDLVEGGFDTVVEEDLGGSGGGERVDGIEGGLLSRAVWWGGVFGGEILVTAGLFNR